MEGRKETSGLITSYSKREYTRVLGMLHQHALQNNTLNHGGRILYVKWLCFYCVIIIYLTKLFEQ